LIEDLGVNLAGVEVILRLTERIRALEAQVEQLQQALAVSNQRHSGSVR